MSVGPEVKCPNRVVCSAMQRVTAVLLLAAENGTACTEHLHLPKSRQGVKVFPSSSFFSMETSLQVQAGLGFFPKSLLF